MHLEVGDLEGGFGIVRVIWDINLEIKTGEIVAIIGSNGAGKTTTMKTIIGLLKPFKGKICLDGEDITRLDTPERLKRKMCLIPEGRQIFYDLTVKQNLLMGSFLRHDKGNIKKDLERIYGFFPELSARNSQLGGTLSGGQQQMLAIGRGLMSGPKLLLIDELSLGLAPVIVDRLVYFIKEINQGDKLSIILVEQDVEIALELASRGYVMEMGKIVTGGESEKLSSDDRIRKVYLGIA